jgi:hypothetical protein
MLIVPGRVYPRDALVQATTILKNVSHSQMWIEQLGVTNEPKPEVLDSEGHVLYPPPFPPPRLNGSFKTGAPPLIAPGAVITEYPLVVLRGNRIHAVLHFHLQTAPPYLRKTLRTSIIRLTLTSGRAPTVAVHRVPPVSAVVHPTTAQRPGDLYHVGWYACRMANGQTQFGGSGFYEGPPGPQGIPPYLVGYLYLWVPSQSRLLQPGCSSPIEWHVVAGWLNQPVVRINYRPPR